MSKKTATPAPRATKKIKNADLGALDQALSDLGANRLPYKLAARTHNMKQTVQEAIKKRDKLRADLTQPYLPEGRPFDSVSTEAEAKRLMGYDGYQEALAKTVELMEDEVELELGAPVDLSTLEEDKLEKLVLLESSQGTLKKHGLIVEPA